MVRFVQYWIERNMESPAEREEKLRQHMDERLKQSVPLKKFWAMRIQEAGFWNEKAAVTTTKERLARAQVDPIDPYSKAIEDIEESKRATNSN